MDALRPIEIATAVPAPILAPGPAMPPENPLAMPVQSLSRWSRAEERPLAASDPYRAPWLARLFVFGGAAALTAYGAYEMYQVVSVSRTTVLQWVLLAPVHRELLLDRACLHERAPRLRLALCGDRGACRRCRRRCARAPRW